MKDLPKLIHSFINPYINQSTNPDNISSRGLGFLSDFLLYLQHLEECLCILQMCIACWLCYPLCQVLLYAGVQGRPLPVLPLRSLYWYHKWTNTFVIIRCGFVKCYKGNAHVDGLKSNECLELDWLK